MNKSRYSESQIISIPKEAEAGVPVAELSRKHGMVMPVSITGVPSTAVWMSSMMKRMKVLEDKNRRLKKMYAEERIKTEIVTESLENSGKAISTTGDGPTSGITEAGLHTAGLPGLRDQRNLLSLTATISGENAHIAYWLLRLAMLNRNRGFGLCFLYLRNVKGYRYTHNRVYRIYRELELNLRIKLKRRLKRGQPDELSVPRQVNEVWSMDFMHDRLEDGRSFRTFNVIDDYNQKVWVLRLTCHCQPCVSFVRWSTSSSGEVSQRCFAAITALVMAFESRGKPQGVCFILLRTVRTQPWHFANSYGVIR